jgi:hypothetical protein
MSEPTSKIIRLKQWMIERLQGTVTHRPRGNVWQIPFAV